MLNTRVSGQAKQLLRSERQVRFDGIVGEPCFRLARCKLDSSSAVISDGLQCFSGVADAGCEHYSIVTGGGPDSVKHEEFTWVNTMLGNVKSAIHGTYHAIHAKHLPRYLAEFSYRFNRRFKLDAMLPRLGYVAVRTPPMPFRLLKLAEVH